jgi:uncharacterized protein YaaQ
MATAVVQEEDSAGLLEALTSAGFHATKIASTGGFLHRGNVTLLIGTEDADLPAMLEIVREHCHARQTGGVQVGGAVIFVQQIEQYHRL